MSGGCQVTLPGTGPAGVIYPPPTRNLVNATQEEYNTTVAWLNQMFVNDTLSETETGDGLIGLICERLKLDLFSHQGLRFLPANCPR